MFIEVRDPLVETNLYFLYILVSLIIKSPPQLGSAPHTQRVSLCSHPVFRHIYGFLFPEYYLMTGKMS